MPGAHTINGIGNTGAAPVPGAAAGERPGRALCWLSVKRTGCRDAGPHVFVPFAAALGAATHVLGDMLTRCGCPLAWPATMREFHLLPRPLRFTTGKLAEHVIVTPLLLIAVALLVWHDAGGPALTGQFHVPVTYGK